MRYLFDEPKKASVPVIEDHETKKLVGIITDRDVAIKSAAYSHREPRRLLVGIISQGDIATRISDKEVAGAVVKEISKLI